MTPPNKLAPGNQPGKLGRPNSSRAGFPSGPSTVVILAPPYPRSGAARVVQNQIEFYRSRGFRTVLVIVPFHRWFMRSNPVWEDLAEGIGEFGAHKAFIAPLDEKRYKAAKYTASLRHFFRGTFLDWSYAIAASAPIPNDLLSFLDTANVALFHVNYVQLLGFAERLRNAIPASQKIPFVLETHDVQSQLLQERSEANPWTHKLDSPERTLRSELALARRVDALVHLSVDDFRFFQKKLPAKRHFLALPAIDEHYVASVNATPPFHEKIDLLFVGQNHAPNVAAIRWFFEQVWPLINEKDYRLNIVGPIDTMVKEKVPQLFEAFRSYFVGTVTDLAPYYSSARCVIAPMVSGSGTSIKTIEALALGKPFVGTPKAFRGMPVEKIHAAGISAYESPRAFADAIVKAVKAEARYGELSRAAYESVFSMRANFAARDEALDSVVRARK
jgi:glycosyltransferase involved in cell wall biosynthesis